MNEPGTPQGVNGPAVHGQPRAKLKIFLGYAPGVGKTSKMIELARRLASEHVDLVLGYVETHGRKNVDGDRTFGTGVSKQSAPEEDWLPYFKSASCLHPTRDEVEGAGV